MPEIGIIGGSGIYDPELFKKAEKREINTPFGKPSSDPIIGEVEGREIAFIPRHGDSHQYNPTEVNSKANIFAFKKLGVERIIATNAVGSLKKEIEPLDVVLPNQIFDRTKKRESTYFEDGIVAHLEFAEPFCEETKEIISESTKTEEYETHDKGTYVCIEGPMFSTKAESKFYRKQGFDIIGMTAIPEAKLAREAEICYSMIATVTDYDVWHESEEVSLELILKRMKKNEKKIKNILKEVIPRIPRKRTCKCKSAVKNTITTDREEIPEETKKKLAPIIQKYL